MQIIVLLTYDHIQPLPNYSYILTDFSIHANSQTSTLSNVYEIQCLTHPKTKFYSRCVTLKPEKLSVFKRVVKHPISKGRNEKEERNHMSQQVQNLTQKFLFYFKAQEYFLAQCLIIQAYNSGSFIPPTLGRGSQYL